MTYGETRYVAAENLQWSNECVPEAGTKPAPGQRMAVSLDLDPGAVVIVAVTVTALAPAILLAFLPFP